MSDLRVALFVDPHTYHFEEDRLFERDSSPLGGHDIMEPYAYLRARLGERGVETHTADLLERGLVPAADVNLFVSFGMRQRFRTLALRHPLVLSAFFVAECPIVEPGLYRDAYDASLVFKRMYSFSEDEAVRPFLRGPVHFHRFHLPQAVDSVDPALWARRERGHLVVINANKRPRLSKGELYSERLRAVEFFDRYGQVDLYGVGWDGPPFRVGETRVPRRLRGLRYRALSRWQRVRPGRDPLLAAARRANRGPVQNKLETLSRYRFAICFENMALDGWITEKLFDCLAAGTVPVYLGAPDIERWVPRECFVDMRSFGGYDELRAFLNGLSPEEVDVYREAGRDYLASDRFRPFTKHAFAEVFERIVDEDAGAPT